MHQAALASFLFRFWLQASPRLSHGSQCLCTQLHLHLRAGLPAVPQHLVWPTFLCRYTSEPQQLMPGCCCDVHDRANIGGQLASARLGCE